MVARLFIGWSLHFLFHAAVVGVEGFFEFRGDLRSGGSGGLGHSARLARATGRAARRLVGGVRLPLDAAERGALWLRLDNTDDALIETVCKLSEEGE